MTETSPSTNNPVLAYREHRLNMYQLYRERIFQENTLINYRISWLLLSEAIILALWGSVAVGLIGFMNKGSSDTFIVLGSLLLLSFLPVSGLILGRYTYRAINACRTEIARLKEKYKDLEKEYEKYPKDPIVLDLSSPDELARDAHSFASVIPVVMICIWAFLLLYSVAYLVLYKSQ